MKSNNVLVVVDMQNDFIDGALGTKEAVGIVGKVVEAVRGFEGEVVFTRDTHYDNYLQTQEGQNLPIPHCLEGSDGWQLPPALKELSEGKTVFDKPGFGSLALANYLKQKGDVDTVVLMGLCTDVCVICNAMILKAALPETIIAVAADCCAGITPEGHNTALKAMEACQIKII